MRQFVNSYGDVESHVMSFDLKLIQQLISHHIQGANDLFRHIISHPIQ